MNMRWNLDALYTSFGSKQFIDDFNNVDRRINEIAKWADEKLRDTQEPIKKIEEYINLRNSFFDFFTRLSDFAELTLSVDSTNETAQKYSEMLNKKYTGLSAPEVKFQKWLCNVKNLDGIISSSPLIREHSFYLHELIEKNKYLLSDSEETVISKMQTTGSSAWSKLQQTLTSTLLVDITIDGDEKHLPLSVVRNMAYSEDKNLRKNAFEAELKSYKKIEDSSAACLNGIKGEVITLSDIRKFKSPLDKTLLDSRMDRETLDVMLDAIKESLPYFHRYYRKKAELLGYKNGLPFYELFAPIGDVDMHFTYNEARDFIVKNFNSFSPDMAKFAYNAFENGWIDAKPREGKEGGAFCANLHSIGESRVMANFTESFDSVITLSHELGHAYHGNCLKGESYINSQYTMPIAETASIFSETLVKNAALKQASDKEAFSMLERDISDSGQVIVDIYSRFLFEKELFKRRAKTTLSVKELKEIMVNAQKGAYGKGLDHDCLHPYMWLNKPHYYYADANFYNFPYAFGLLFGKGLYAKYLKSKDTFVNKYKKLLSVTGKMKIADVAATMDIDIHSIDFWKSSLNTIKEDIDKFMAIK